MPVYTWKCDSCEAMTAKAMSIAEYETDCTPTSEHHCGGTMRRSYDPPVVRPAMAGHWNPTLGRYVSGEREFRDGLKEASDRESERTGVVHNYQPIDFRETQALGVTAEGLDSTARSRHSEGKTMVDPDRI